MGDRTVRMYIGTNRLSELDAGCSHKNSAKHLQNIMPEAKKSSAHQQPNALAIERLVPHVVVESVTSSIKNLQ